MVRIAMKSWSVRQIVALLLGVFVTLGMSLSAVEASDMTVKMTMTTEMGSAAHDDCKLCPGGDRATPKAAVCKIVCTTPVFSMLPLQLASLAIAMVAADVSLPGHMALPGKTSAPDPYPPRPTDLG